VRFQVTPDHYSQNYDTKERFCSYWHQIQEITTCNPKTVLEIGIGNGFVSEYLRKTGFNVTTSDLDGRLHPNVASTVLNIPFAEAAFDVVACFELLEHLPFEKFENAIKEMRRVSVSFVILSIPESTQAYRLLLQLPKIGEFKKLLTIPALKKPEHSFDVQHYWEIGKAGYSLKRILAGFAMAGLNVKRTYRVFEFPYHRFFVLEKIR